MKVNGFVTSVDADDFTVRVKQAFGNCPKYIQARTVEMSNNDPAQPKSLHEIVMLGEKERSPFIMHSRWTENRYYLINPLPNRASEAAL